PRARTRTAWRSQLVGEHRSIMAIPLALEALVGIVFLFQAEELRQLRVAPLDLRAGSIPVVGQVVASAARDPHVYERTKGVGRPVDALRRVDHVQIEDDAGIPVGRPREKGLVVFFAETDR